ncbi:hypothetical protein RPQ07_37200 [Streptomyces sp. AM8-1-1]|nr:hypothetical protein [Streptomyces sp. AM8-1-1]WNO77427.1 hypothetical protein RPQ07_37200 [Streptomyces sp. AM8-1-1]
MNSASVITSSLFSGSQILRDQGTPIEAACGIIILEDQLEEAQRINAEHRRTTETANPTAAA